MLEQWWHIDASALISGTLLELHSDLIGIKCKDAANPPAARGGPLTSSYWARDRQLSFVMRILDV